MRPTLFGPWARLGKGILLLVRIERLVDGLAVVLFCCHIKPFTIDLRRRRPGYGLRVK